MTSDMQPDPDRLRDELRRLEREDEADPPMRILVVAAEPVSGEALSDALGPERAEAAELRVEVADPDGQPLAAVDEALESFPADEIVLLTGDDELVDEARKRFDQPVERLPAR
jgi:hypothetical protein